MLSILRVRTVGCILEIGLLKRRACKSFSVWFYLLNRAYFLLDKCMVVWTKGGRFLIQGSDEREQERRMRREDRRAIWRERC